MVRISSFSIQIISRINKAKNNRRGRLIYSTRTRLFLATSSTTTSPRATNGRNSTFTSMYSDACCFRASAFCRGHTMYSCFSRSITAFSNTPSCSEWLKLRIALRTDAGVNSIFLTEKIVPTGQREQVPLP